MRALLKRFNPKVLIGVGVIVMLVATLAGLAALRGSPDATKRTVTARSKKAADIYAGLGAWVDLWDTRAWRDPAGTVDDMASHGVRTLYIETGTAKTPNDVAMPEKMREFISAAHEHDMYVVAWYLPNLKAGSVDLRRVVKAVEFETADGERFDSVALDIESTSVKSIAKRNRNLATLSQQVRASVGSKYPLGGIIPSPVGIRKQTGFWNVFPYATVAQTYDVLMPMAYYTFHGQTAEQAKTDATESMRILREQPGCGELPVHLIGGVSGASSAGEVKAFAKAAKATGCIGASLYDWAGTRANQWDALEAVWRDKAK